MAAVAVGAAVVAPSVGVGLGLAPGSGPAREHQASLSVERLLPDGIGVLPTLKIGSFLAGLVAAICSLLVLAGFWHTQLESFPLAGFAWRSQARPRAPPRA